jgi:cytochrome c1
MLSTKRAVPGLFLILLLFLTGCLSELFADPYEYVTGGNAEIGDGLILGYGCGSCHIIPGINGADGRVGPPLEKWAERVYIAGKLPNNPENLILWLMNPQEIKPGTAMPNMDITEKEARDISAYLYTLR